MATWTCPNCDRSFGKAGTGHMCMPGLSIDEFLAEVPDFVAPVLERVCDHLMAVDAAEAAESGSGDLIIDPLIKKKVLFKNGPTFCIVEVKTKWVAVGFSLRRKLESGRLSRKVADYGNKFFHVINVVDPEQIDDEFCAWLTEAYHHGSGGGDTGGGGAEIEARPSAFDPMVPDDVDIW